MKLLKYPSCATLLLLNMLLTACSKDNDPGSTVIPEPTEIHQCRLLKINTSGGNYRSYIYNADGKISRIDDIYPSDTVQNSSYQYTYNAAGQAVEEILVTSGNLIENKRVFAYNADNLLDRMEVYSIRTGGLSNLGEYYLFQYNNTGGRILAQHFSGSQPSVSDFYSEYTYFQNEIREKRYNALTTPATLIDSSSIRFDDKKSPFHALGHLAAKPGYDKHNITSIDSSNPNEGGYTIYDYNSLGYPIKGEGYYDFFYHRGTFEYACH